MAWPCFESYADAQAWVASGHLGSPQRPASMLAESELAQCALRAGTGQPRTPRCRGESDRQGAALGERGLWGQCCGGGGQER